MCSKVLNGHIILTDTSITTILAPEMTYTPFPRGRLQQERSPQRLIGRQPAAGEVARGETADGESVAERLLFVPVQLDDLRRVEAPVLEVLAHAQRTDDRADALF